MVGVHSGPSQGVYSEITPADDDGEEGRISHAQVGGLEWDE